MCVLIDSLTILVVRPLEGVVQPVFHTAPAPCIIGRLKLTRPTERAGKSLK